LAWVDSELVSNGLKFLVKVKPVIDSSVRVTDLGADDVELLWPLEQAAIPRPRTIAAATPFMYA
jgi:hypothetical protein